MKKPIEFEKLLKIDDTQKDDIESRLRKKERKNAEILRISSQAKNSTGESNRSCFCSIKRRDFSKEFMELQEKMKELQYYMENNKNHHKMH